MCSYMWSWHLRLDETHKTRSVVNDVVQSFGHENHVSGFQIVRPFLAQNSAPFAATDSQFPTCVFLIGTTTRGALLRWCLLQHVAIFSCQTSQDVKSCEDSQITSNSSQQPAVNMKLGTPGNEHLRGLRQSCPSGCSVLRYLGSFRFDPFASHFEHSFDRALRLQAGALWMQFETRKLLCSTCRCELSSQNLQHVQKISEDVPDVFCAFHSVFKV